MPDHGNKALYHIVLRLIREGHCVTNKATWVQTRSQEKVKVLCLNWNHHMMGDPAVTVQKIFFSEGHEALVKVFRTLIWIEANVQKAIEVSAVDRKPWGMWRCITQQMLCMDVEFFTVVLQQNTGQLLAVWPRIHSSMVTFCWAVWHPASWFSAPSSLNPPEEAHLVFFHH